MRSMLAMRTSLPATLFITFLVLKLTAVIDWSWWWVTAPLWVPFALFAAFLVFIVAAAITAGIMESK
jgi:phosphoglycerol transferase MdoB-like AlkP superfamily enzyme